MHDRTVSFSCLASVLLWGVTLLLVLAGTVVGVAGDPNDDRAWALGLMANGLACAAGAATVSIRYMFKKQSRFLRSAFELGRDAATGPQSVRSVRP